ncbi:MAG: site-2 protease family protein, partial [Oscillospiraceae bacterium]
MRFDFFDIIVRAIVLLTTIPVHEAAHAYVADRLGDPTARYQGRLTLNPMAHFDLIGSMAMIFTGIGWAKPVPINPRNFDEPKKGMAISAAAGPISNLLLATASLA